MELSQRNERGRLGASGRPGWGQTGASAVEFAIVLPVLVLLVFGIVQFGIAYNRVQGLNAAAREGARLASVGAGYSDIQTRVQSAQSLFAAADVQVDTCSSPSGTSACTPTTGQQDTCASAGVGGQLTVQATVAPNPTYAINIPLMPGAPYSIGYSASGVFRCERTGP